MQLYKDIDIVVKHISMHCENLDDLRQLISMKYFRNILQYSANLTEKTSHLR